MYNDDTDSKMLRPRFPNGLLKTVFLIQKNKEAYSEPCQTSKMELFVKIVDGRCQLTKLARAPTWMFHRILT